MKTGRSKNPIFYLLTTTCHNNKKHIVTISLFKMKSFFFRNKQLIFPYNLIFSFRLCGITKNLITTVYVYTCVHECVYKFLKLCNTLNSTHFLGTAVYALGGK